MHRHRPGIRPRPSAPAAALLAVAALWCATAAGQAADGARGPLPPGFTRRVLAHAGHLAGRGPRPASSEGERAARAYVAARLADAGIEAHEEPFTFEEFELRSAALTLAGRAVEPVLVAFGPFAGELSFSGEAVPVTAGAEPPPGLAGRIVVTDHPLVHLMLLDEDPKLVVCVGREEYARFTAQDDRHVSLQVEGNVETLRSANLVARVAPPGATGPGVLLTAHLDAWQSSPGANDNGTGLGALVELARFFREAGAALPGPVTLVAFGAEELGAVGSRTFLRRHVAALPDIAAVVNLDTLGGADGPQLGSPATVEGIGEGGRADRIPAELAGRAWEGRDGRWRIQHRGVLPFITASCTPPWLDRAVQDSAAALGLELRTRSLMSDHRTFTQAGVPAISIQSGRHTIHSPDDTADRLVPETIGRAGALASRIVWTVLQRRAAPAATGRE